MRISFEKNHEGQPKCAMLVMASMVDCSLLTRPDKDHSLSSVEHCQVQGLPVSGIDAAW